MLFKKNEITLSRIVDLIRPLVKIKRKKPTIITLIRPKEENHSIARVTLPDTPFMNAQSLEGGDCSDRSSNTNKTWLLFEAVLFQSNFDNPNELKKFIV